MEKVFLSYSTRDHFFAALAEVKLKEEGLEIWRDQSQIRPGEEWRKSIDNAISQSRAVIVALSKNSVESGYVTYEWSYAFGLGVTVIGAKLESCEPHSKLRDTQIIDFSNPHSLPWKRLGESIRQIETNEDSGSEVVDEINRSLEDETVQKVLTYLNSRGYQMASFDRLRANTGLSLSDEDFRQLIHNNNRLLAKARLKAKVPGGESRPGLKKMIP